MIVAAPPGFRRTVVLRRLTTRMLVSRSGLNYLSTSSGQVHNAASEFAGNQAYSSLRGGR